MKNRKMNQWNSFRVTGINWVLWFGLGCASLALCFIILINPEAEQYEQQPKSIINNFTVVDGTDWELAVQYIKDSESFQSVQYELDGHWYIGYGHLISDSKPYPEITEHQATKLLEKDLLHMIKYATTKYTLTGSRALAVGMLFYNVRHSSILNSKLHLELLKGCRNWNEKIISTSWLSMCKFQGKEHSGLKQRRQFELNLFFGK